MFLTPEPFGKMTLKEIRQHLDLLNGLHARLAIDDLKEDHRKSREVLKAKFLATEDVKRARASLKAYLDLIPDVPMERSA